MLSQEQWEGINDIVATINATKNTYAIRTAFLKKLMRLVDFDFSDFNIGIMRNTATPYLVDPVVVSKFNKEFEEDFIYQYESTYASMDYVSWIFLSSESLIYRESDLVNDELRKKNPFYLHYLKVFDLVNVAGMVLASGGEFLGAVTLYRKEKNGDFSDLDMYILQQLLPHLENKFAREEEVMKKNAKSLSYLLRNEYQLTNREIEVIGYLCKGITNNDIAKALEIAPNTVKKHVYNLFYKLGVDNRVQLVKFIYNNGLEDLWGNCN